MVFWLYLLSQIEGFMYEFGEIEGATPDFVHCKVRVRGGGLLPRACMTFRCDDWAGFAVG